MVKYIRKMFPHAVQHHNAMWTCISQRNVSENGVLQKLVISNFKILVIFVLGIYLTISCIISLQYVVKFHIFFWCFTSVHKQYVCSTTVYCSSANYALAVSSLPFLLNLIFSLRFSESLENIGIYYICYINDKLNTHSTHLRQTKIQT